MIGQQWILSLLILGATILQGCPFGEAPPAYGAIEALSPDETPEDAAETVKRLALSAGFEQRVDYPGQIYPRRTFGLRFARVWIDVLIVTIPAGTDIVLKFHGGWGEDFDEVAEPGYSRLRDLLIERYGERNVATGTTFYCCGLRERYTYKSRHFR